MKKLTYYSLFLLFFIFSLAARGENLIIRYHDNVNPQEVLAFMSEASQKVLVEPMNIHHIEVVAPFSSSALIQNLKNNPNVKWVQKDHPVTMRREPNDPDFSRQWGLHSPNNSDIDAPQAWEHGVGGSDSAGNEIVVAVIDGGVDVNHDSLSNNIWSNREEIPGNGVDDDNNGYVDDVNGWNVHKENGNIPAHSHGTHVAGIIGARGNDSHQITGVNWNVKVMGIAGMSGSSSVVVKAYSYVLKQKQMWLESNGQRGANVVSTNSSFGVDFADCSSGDFPVWNDMYNAMGEAGILSAAATINSSVDVDVRGDVPTGCSSPYIIAVTNTNENGNINSRAGYGQKSIDLGAPGTDILSTVPGNRVREMTGTSMATPHVAGAVGFLHSVASNAFTRRYMSNPGQAALELKQWILNTVHPQEDLVGNTVSGGRLNLNQAARQARGL